MDTLERSELEIQVELERIENNINKKNKTNSPMITKVINFIIYQLVPSESYLSHYNANQTRSRFGVY